MKYGRKSIKNKDNQINYMSLFLMAIVMHTLAPPQVSERPKIIIKIAPSVKQISLFLKNYLLIITGFFHFINDRIKLKTIAETQTPHPRLARAANE